MTGYAVVEPSPRGPFVRRGGRDPAAMSARRAIGRAARPGSTRASSRCSTPSRPSALALEQVHSHVEHPRTAILMAHARGVIVLAAAQRGVPVFGYAATRIKKTLTGSGQAPKEQIQHAIRPSWASTGSPSPTTSPTPAPSPSATSTSAATSDY